MTQSAIPMEGKSYKVVHEFRPDRLLIDYDGLFVIVELQGGEWDFSGEPANAKEREVLAKFTAPMNDKSVVKVIKDD